MILLGGQVESISTRKDKTIRLTIGTQELTPTQSSELFQLNQLFCYIGIKPEPFSNDEQQIVDILKSDYNAKTPSQRLRGILYKIYEQNAEGYKDFNSFYLSKMEKICDHYKTKIDA